MKNWYPDTAEDNLKIVLALLTEDLTARNIPPMVASALAEELVSTALLIDAPPHMLQLWVADQPPREPTAAGFRNWYEWFKLQPPPKSPKPEPTQGSHHIAGVWV